MGAQFSLSSETKELQNFPSQSQGALPRVPTTLAFFNPVSEAWRRGACVLGYLPQALSLMKPHGSRTAAVLPEGNMNYLRAAPTLTSNIRLIEEAFCLPSGRVVFSANVSVHADEPRVWKSAVCQGGHFNLSVHLIFPVVGRTSCA